MASNTFTTSDGVSIAYQVLGNQSSRKNIPLLLIQGLSGVKEDWGSFAVDLAKNRPVIIFDNRGIGESSIPDGPYSVQSMARDAHHLVAHLGLTDLHLMGISMGGMISQWFVLTLDEFNSTSGKNPIKVHRLVLGCTTPGGDYFAESPPHEDFWKTMAAGSMAEGPLSEQDKYDIVAATAALNLTRAYVQSQPEAFKEFVLANLKYRRSARGISHQMMGVSSHDSTSRLGEIAQLTNATLIIHGDSDLVVPLPNALGLNRGIPGSRLHLLRDVGHVFWQMDNGESLQAVEAFLLEVGSKL